MRKSDLVNSIGIATNFKRGYNPALSLGAWRSPASALAWGARGRRFKSSRPDWLGEPPKNTVIWSRYGGVFYA